MRFMLRFLRWMPKALNKVHLEWALAELSAHNPLHQDIPYIVHKLRELES